MLPYNASSPQAEAIAALFRIVLIIASVIFLIVTSGVLYNAIRFRAGADRGEPAQTEGNLRLEIGWTAVPLFLLVVILILTIRTMDKANPAVAAASEPDIIITGHQWWWEIEYPQAGFTTANEIHIPTGRPVLIQLESADVIHSFWIPELRGKQDMIPGDSRFLWLEASNPGLYLGSCAEFCGIQHAWMRIRVYAQTADEYQTWLAQQAQPPALTTASDAVQGAQLFQEKTCNNCHAVGEATTVNIGPNLSHLASRDTLAAGTLPNTAENLADWLRDPQAVKPGNYMPNFRLSEAEVQLLVTYLETLK